MHPVEVLQDPVGRPLEVAKRTADGAVEAAKLAERTASTAASIAAERAAEGARAVGDAAEATQKGLAKQASSIDLSIGDATTTSTAL